MGWAHGRLTGWVAATRHYEGRDVGYGVLAECDWPGCLNEIDLGLGYRCGVGTLEDIEGALDAARYGGCGGYFCREHSAPTNHACPAPSNWGPEGDVGAGDDWLGCQTVGVGELSHQATDEVEAAIERGENPECPECVRRAASAAPGVNRAVSR